jgi:hypothetical protein
MSRLGRDKLRKRVTSSGVDRSQAACVSEAFDLVKEIGQTCDRSATVRPARRTLNRRGCSSFRSCDSLGMRELRGCEAPYDSPSLLTTFSMRRLGRDEEAAEGTVSGTR